MSALTQEALEWVLLELEAKELEVDPPVELACMSCYESQADCACLDPMLWPISHVINKLRVELSEAS